MENADSNSDRLLQAGIRPNNQHNKGKHSIRSAGIRGGKGVFR